ncbi:MAG: thermonuclease family protein [Deltaproteobacteria bacterium]|nr:thermonuclease family protein [Deltaproteobacteria bacterium]
MTRLILLFILLFPAHLAAQETVPVKYVIDGDTIILNNGKKVRYIGIDAPEIAHGNSPAEHFGDAARTFNSQLTGSAGVYLEYDREPRDRYGRHLAYVFLSDDTFVNQRLLFSGLAIFLYKPPNLKYAEILLQAQRTAMSGKKGVWKSWIENPRSYLGNRKSKRFHLPGCPYGKNTAQQNRVSFKNRWDAYWKGYAPCKKCIKNRFKF